jgi:proline dehydrogenase
MNVMNARNGRRGPGFLWVPVTVSLFLLAIGAYLYGERWLRLILIYLSHAGWARQMISGLPIARRVARRFVAGETIDEAMAATQALNARQLMVTLDYLGESVTDKAIADASRDEILRVLDRIEAAGLDANVSVKLSQLGLRIHPDIALENSRQILERAQRYDNRVRIDMEESELVDKTLNIYRTLRDDMGYQNVGVVIQAYLYRSERDVARLIQEGAWVRLCKGAYAEPPDIAFAHKADTDANYVKLTHMMLSEEARARGVYLGIATHDENMINAALEFAQSQGIRPDEFEFQMLYGIRRDLQESLISQGYRVRTYVPYGTAWYPYFVRRLAERPANLWFFVSNLFKR